MRLTDSTGKLVFDEQEESSKLQICDFGFGDHQLIVGYNRCYPTTISGLRFRPGRPIHLTVQLNKCPPDVWGGRSCSVYFRVHEPGGPKIGGASVSLGTNSSPDVTDSFGRVESILPAGTSAIAMLSKKGYVSERISIHCTQSEDIDREVILIPVPN